MILIYVSPDPDVLNFPLLKKPLHFYKDQSEAPQLLRDTGKIIEAADAYVVVTAEYNNCLPPALTNLLDHFSPSSYQYRPSGIVCYSAGSYAGVRASTQARTLLGELGTPSIGSLLTIPKIQNTLTEDGTKTEERIDRSAERMIKELAWYATAIKTHKETHGYPK